METTDVKTCTIKRKVLMDARVEAEFPYLSRYHYGGKEKTPKEYARELEQEIKSFVDFLRDHRSQDLIQLSVERDEADICSNCIQPWEPDKDEDGIYCACCGARLQEADDGK